MSDALQLTYLMATPEQPAAFTEKDSISLTDQNQTVYQQAQIRFDTSSISTVNKWLLFSEAEVVVPITITATSGSDATGTYFQTAASARVPTLGYYIGCKAGSHMFFNSIYATMNGATVSQSQNYLSTLMHWRLLTTVSPAVVETIGSKYLFYPDDAISNPVVTDSNGNFAWYKANIDGTNYGQSYLIAQYCNNHVADLATSTFNAPCPSGVFPATAGIGAPWLFKLRWKLGQKWQNTGLFNRCKVIHDIVVPMIAGTIDVNSGANISGTEYNSSRNLRRNTVLLDVGKFANNLAKTHTYSVYLKIPLRHMHDVFQQINFPVRGIRLQLDMNMNVVTACPVASIINSAMSATAAPNSGVLPSTPNILGLPLNAAGTGTVAQNGMSPGNYAGFLQSMGCIPYGTPTIYGGTLVNPLMVTELGGSNVASGDSCYDAASTVQPFINTHWLGGWIRNVTWSIGISGAAGTAMQSCVMNIPVVDLPAQYIDKALSGTVRNISFLDHQFFNYTNLGNGNTINLSITQGVKNMRRIWLLPFFRNSTTANGATGFDVPVTLNPTCSEPCTVTAGSSFSNIQLLLGGQNMFNSPLQYSYDFFKQVVEDNLYAGGQDTVTQIGFIDEHKWLKNYGALVFNLSRKIKAWPLNEAISVQLQCTNYSTFAQNLVVFDNTNPLGTPTSVTQGNYLDLWVFIEYEKVLSLNQSAGSAEIVVAG